MQFPRHKCGLALQHNEHRNYYESIENQLRDHYEWESEESRELAIENDDVWTLQWYPDTPIGFFAIASHSLEHLLEYAQRVEAENEVKHRP